MARKSKSVRDSSKQSKTEAQTSKIRNKQPADIQNRSKQNQQTDKLKTSSDLFVNGTTNRMASALPIWEASSILAQKKDLPWSIDPNGKLCYAKDVENGKGAVLFWLTEDLEQEHPATLAGAAAIAVIDAFDIRAACMHLIYAAHAAQLEKPWEQEFVIDARQIEEYLGLKKRSDLNRQQKLALIQEIAQQPCKITTYISWPAQGKVKGFTIEKGRLWHLLGVRHHYQQDLFGHKDLEGITFVVRPGLWARYFLSEDSADFSAYCQTGTLSKALLEDVMRVWQQREGAARLMIWLLFKTKVDMKHLLSVQALMEIAYGPQKIEAAKLDNRLRNKLANTWDEDLLVMHERGWQLHFHSQTYPPEIQPLAFGRRDRSRPRSFFAQLLSAHMWISPPEGFSQNSISTEEEGSKPQVQQAVLPAKAQHTLSGTQVRALRIKKGWTQRELASLTGLSQSLIQLIEKNQRNITRETQRILERTLTENLGDLDI